MQECSFVVNVTQVNRNQRQAHVMNLAVPSFSIFSPFAIHVFTPKHQKKKKLLDVTAQPDSMSNTLWGNELIISLSIAISLAMTTASLAF